MKGEWGPILLAVLIAGMSVTAGCGDKGKDTGEDTDTSTEPAALTIFFQAANPSVDEFNSIFVNPLKEKHPNIKLERVIGDGKLENLVAAGQTPDLIYAHVGNLYAIKELGLLDDLTPLIKKNNVDMNRFNPIVLQAIEQATPGHLSAFPYMLNLKALYYNKDLFDKFGVPYPKDGMTWDDAIEVGKRVTRTDGGNPYKGFIAYAVTSLQRSMGNSFYDPKTKKGTLDTPEWKSFFDVWVRIYKIPGNELTRPTAIDGDEGRTEFFKDRTLAMLGQNNLFSELEVASKDGLNWDVAQYPSLPSKPNIMTDVDAHLVLISSTSKHKEAAMKVLISVTSDEVQMMIAKRYAKMSPLADPKFKTAFGKDLPYADAKNIAGIFKSGITISPIRDEISGYAIAQIDTAFDAAYFDNKDINSALRDANEQVNKFIAQKESK